MFISTGAILALFAAATPGTWAIRDSLEADAALIDLEESIDHSSELSESATASRDAEQELVEYSSKYSDVKGEDTEQKLVTQDACAALVMVHSGEKRMAQDYYRGIYEKTGQEQFGRPVYVSKEEPRRYIFFTDVKTSIMKTTAGWVIGKDWKQEATDSNIGIRFLDKQKERKYECPHDVTVGTWFEHDSTSLLKKWVLNKDIVVEAVDEHHVPEVPKGPKARVVKAEKSPPKLKKLTRQQRRLTATEDWKPGDKLKATTTLKCTWPESIKAKNDCVIHKGETGEILEVINEGDILGRWRYEKPGHVGLATIVNKIVGKEHRDKLDRTEVAEARGGGQGQRPPLIFPQEPPVLDPNPLAAKRQFEGATDLTLDERIETAYPVALDLDGAEQWWANGRWEFDSVSKASLPIYKKMLDEPLDDTNTRSLMHYMFFQESVRVWMVGPNVDSTGFDAILKSEETAATCPSQVQHWNEYQAGWKENPKIKVHDPNPKAQGSGGFRREQSPPRFKQHDQPPQRVDQQVCPPHVILQGCPEWFSGVYNIQQGASGAPPEYRRATSPEVVVFYDTQFEHWVVTDDPQRGVLLWAEAQAGSCPHQVPRGQWNDYNGVNGQWYRNAEIQFLEAPQAQHGVRQDHIRSGRQHDRDHYQPVQPDNIQPLHSGDYQPLIQPVPIQQDCPAKVYVSGANYQPKALGPFSIMSGASGSGWPVYQSQGQQEVQYIYFHDTTNKWMVGPRIGNEICRISGQAPVGPTRHCPHDVTDWWEYDGYHQGDFVYNGGITVQAANLVCGDDFQRGHCHGGYDFVTLDSGLTDPFACRALCEQRSGQDAPGGTLCCYVSNEAGCHFSPGGHSERDGRDASRTVTCHDPQQVLKQVDGNVQHVANKLYS